MEKTTKIQLSIKTKKELDSLRLSDRDTYNDIINNLIEDSMEVSDETKKEIEEALEQIEKGDFLTHEEVKKKMGF